VRVLFLSDLETLGGAGLSASRLAAGLAAKGVEVTRFFNNPARAPHLEPVTWTSRYVGPARPAEVVLNGARRIFPQVSRAAGRALSGLLLRKAIAETRFDLLHIHSIQNCDWSHEVLGTLDGSLPTVWTFHDCWSFAAESQRYRDLDGHDVRLKPDGDDREAALRMRKRYFDSRKHLALIANSEFTAREADKLLGIRPEVILPGTPLSRFRPVPREAARQSLRLPVDANVLLFVADNPSDPLKGFEVLRRALGRLDREDVILMVAGEAPANLPAAGRAQLRSFGRVLAPELLAIVYSAADALVVPSLAEGLGMVSMESIACGTPVVGSAVGGIPEVVLPETTGWLVPPGQPEALVRRLTELFAEPAARSAMAARCRPYAEAHWSIERHVEQHLALYSRLLAHLD
jgi:glycosyltransferase involved in cell wall biosynthesis